LTTEEKTSKPSQKGQVTQMEALEQKLSEIKSEAMKEYEKVLNKQLEQYASATRKKDLTIDMVETLMGEARREGEEIIKGVAEKVIQTAESELVEKKRYVPNVGIS